MNTFLTSNRAIYRLLRTVAQIVIGYLIDNAAMLIAHTDFSADTQVVIVGLVVTVLSAVMKALGTEDEKIRDEGKEVF